jgi:hypothetical protein
VLSTPYIYKIEYSAFYFTLAIFIKKAASSTYKISRNLPTVVKNKSQVEVIINAKETSIALALLSSTKEK